MSSFPSEIDDKLTEYVRSLSREHLDQYYIQADREECKSLRVFVERAWHVLEPSNPFVPGWHIDAICTHLVAVTMGDIRNLLINMPPRMSKSLIVAVFWPTWVWTFKPALRWLYSSYAEDLAIRDSVKCRNVIQSAWYQQRWGDKYQLVSDQNIKTNFANTKTGYRLATSVGGKNTGQGADVICCDDGNNVKEAESILIREGTNLWWSEVMASRFNNPKTVARVIIQQRTHDHDMSGFVLEKGNYVHLCLPMEFEPERCCYVPVTGWQDPRTEAGQLLCPERVGPRELVEIKAELRSEYAVAGQLQQRPAPRGGGLIQLSWFKRYKLIPRQWTRLVQSWDTAHKAKEENAPWVCTTWLECDSQDYLLEVYREWMEYPEGKRAVYSQAEKWSPDVVLIEDKSSGQALIQEVRENNRLRAQATRHERESLPQALTVIPVQPDADKVTRMEVEADAIQGGNVWLPEQASWLGDYEQEIRSFPKSQFADQVDSTSQYLKWRRQRRQKFVADKPIFTSFVRTTHVAASPFQFGHNGDAKPFDSKRWMWRAWHTGTHTGVNACVWAQLNDRRLYVFGSRQQAGAFCSDIGYEQCEVPVQGLGAFIDEMKALHHDLYPRAQWQDVGTDDIFRPPGRITQEVPWQVFTNNKIMPVQATTKDPATLINYIDAWLEAMVQGEAALQLAPNASVLIDAFAGGYHWHQEKGGKPADGPFNSVMLCLQALCSRLPTKPFMAGSRPETLVEPRSNAHDSLFPTGVRGGERWDQW